MILLKTSGVVGIKNKKLNNIAAIYNIWSNLSQSLTFRLFVIISQVFSKSRLVTVLLNSSIQPACCPLRHWTLDFARNATHFVQVMISIISTITPKLLNVITNILQYCFQIFRIVFHYGTARFIS